MQRAQAAEAQVEAVAAQSRQQHSHPVHAEAQLEEASASVGDAASMRDASLEYSPADAQLISQVDCPAVQLCGMHMLNMQDMSEASLAVLLGSGCICVQMSEHICISAWCQSSIFGLQPAVK